MVDGIAITENRVAILLSPEKRRLVARFPDGGPEYDRQLQAAREASLNELIEREKLLQQHKQALAPVAAGAIDKEIQREIRENYAGDKERFASALVDSRMTMKGYRKLTEEKLLAEAFRPRAAKKK